MTISSKDGAPTPIWTAGGLNTPSSPPPRSAAAHAIDPRYCLRYETMPNAPAATHALKVLRLLARHAAPLPASAIARELELPRSSTYHLLGVLKDEGFVVHLPEQRRYGLGVAAFELGSAYERQESLRWIAQTVLTRLVSATTHNAHLAVLHGRDVLYVIEERAPEPAGAGHRRRRPAPGAPDRERAGDARRAPAAAARPRCSRTAGCSPSATTPARTSLTQLRALLAHRARARLRRGGRVRHARGSPRSRARCSTTRAIRSRRSR